MLDINILTCENTVIVLYLGYYIQWASLLSVFRTEVASTGLTSKFVVSVLRLNVYYFYDISVVILSQNRLDKEFEINWNQIIE